jgi:4-hydroxy-tetrahydrodipicolinate reductase
MTLRIAIAGINGRMGQMLQQAVAQNNQTSLSLGIVLTAEEIPPTQPQDHQLTTDLSKHSDDFDVLIDFTAPQATLKHIEICAQSNKPIVIGTTGFTEQQKKTIHEQAKNLPILFSPNMSYGVNLCFRLLSLAAEAMKEEDVDIEIIEMHHRHKKDAPSGTALGMGKAIAESMDINLEKQSVYCREGVIGEREEKTIGFQSIRGGDVIGDHTAIFAFNGERIEITHKANNRKIYADGAVKAACWLKNKNTPGLYTMQDVISN